MPLHEVMTATIFLIFCNIKRPSGLMPPHGMGQCLRFSDAINCTVLVCIHIRLDFSPSYILS